MGIQHFTVPVALVSCQHCPACIVVPKWPDARTQGWAVELDGNAELQLCPACVAAHNKKLIDENRKRPRPAT